MAAFKPHPRACDLALTATLSTTAFHWAPEPAVFYTPKNLLDFGVYRLRIEEGEYCASTL